VASTSSGTPKTFIPGASLRPSPACCRPRRPQVPERIDEPCSGIDRRRRFEPEPWRRGWRSGSPEPSRRVAPRWHPTPRFNRPDARTGKRPQLLSLGRGRRNVLTMNRSDLGVGRLRECCGVCGRDTFVPGSFRFEVVGREAVRAEPRARQLAGLDGVLRRERRLGTPDGGAGRRTPPAGQGQLRARRRRTPNRRSWAPFAASFAPWRVGQEPPSSAFPFVLSRRQEKWEPLGRMCAVPKEESPR
jgi:hypothetical protein